MIVLQKNPSKTPTQKASRKFGYIFLKMISIVSLQINWVSMIKKAVTSDLNICILRESMTDTVCSSASALAAYYIYIVL